MSYPKRLKTNWRKMKIATLRKYARFHQIQMRPGATSREYVNAVARHFQEAKSGRAVNTHEVLHRFMTTMKRKAFRSASANSLGAIKSWDETTPASEKKPARKGKQKRRKRAETDKQHKRERKNGNNGGRSSSMMSQTDGRRCDGTLTGKNVEVFWGPPHNRWFSARVKEFGTSQRNFYTLVYKDKSEEFAKLYEDGQGESLGDTGTLEPMKWRLKASRGSKPGSGGASTKSASSRKAESNSRGRSNATSSGTTYKSMICKSLEKLSEENGGEMRGTFKEICATMKTLYATKLNWKTSGDARKTPVWKSSVRKILFAANQFKRTKDAQSGAHIFSL